MNIRAMLHTSLLLNFGSKSSLQYFYPLQSILNTEAKVIFLSPKSDHVTSLLKTLLQLSISLRAKAEVLLLAYRAHAIRYCYLPTSPPTVLSLRSSHTGPCTLLSQGLALVFLLKWPSLRYHMMNFLTRSESFLSCHPPNETDPDHPI